MKVACANPKAAHGDKTYALLPGSYTIGTVAGDATAGYTCPVTIHSAPYVAAYNAVAGAAHTLQPDGQAAKSITLSWDGASQAWACGTAGFPSPSLSFAKTRQYPPSPRR